MLKICTGYLGCYTSQDVCRDDSFLKQLSKYQTKMRLSHERNFTNAASSFGEQNQIRASLNAEERGRLSSEQEKLRCGWFGHEI